MDHDHHHHHHHGPHQPASTPASQGHYVCPMHPDVIRQQPGKCPKCGMDLVPLTPVESTNDPSHAAHTADGYDKHKGHHTSDFLKRFWICTALSVPVLLMSHMIQGWLGFHLDIPGSKWWVLALSSFIYAYGGWPFIKGMLGEIRANAIGMMTLVAVAITVAYAYSVAVVAGLPGMDFFWELVTLIDIMLLGHWLEMRSQLAASSALQSLIALLPSTVHVDREGTIVDVPLAEIRKEDVLLIKPGEKFPADGEVMEGSTDVNESMLTGESMPVKKTPGDPVIGGSINGAGAVKVRVKATGHDSYLQKVIALVSGAQASKSKTQNLADRVARWLTIISLTVGVLSLVIWLTAGESMPFALERMVTVMVTACPHALGVAIPLVVAISTALSATHGLLIRNRTAFEMARLTDAIIFDKTGTLTEGSHQVQRIIPYQTSYSDKELLRLAASVQQASEHHIAKGILTAAKKENITPAKADHFRALPGQGVEAVVEGRHVVIGGPNYLVANEVSVPALPGDIDQQSESISFILIDRAVHGIITMADTIRPGSASAIEKLQSMDIKCYLLTGDNEPIAKRVSETLHMDGYFANVLPHQKLEQIQAFQQKHVCVAMVGDGVNDAPALAQADVGIAIGSGTDVAAETADIILVNSDPHDVVRIIRFAKSTYRKMQQNLMWAVGYNVIAIPLAAGILYPAFILTPALGAVLMSLSTIIVAVNARGLKFQ